MATEAGESSLNFLPQGTFIQVFIVGGQNIVHAFPGSSQYLDAAFFGETIGRTSDRILAGEIQDLNGVSVKLAQNDGRNHLHGRTAGWGKTTFVGSVPVKRDGKPGVYFTYTSPHGDESYPVRSAYDAEEGGVSKRVLEVDYKVIFSSHECEETVVGVTNHSYLNLTGFPTIDGTTVTLCTNRHLVIDDQIPSRAIEAHPGIEADSPFTSGPREPAIDHCFVTNVKPQNVSLDTRDQKLQKLVDLTHPQTNLQLDVFSTEPTFQLYTGEFIDVPANKDSPAKPPRSGICIEPCRYINSINVL